MFPWFVLKYFSALGAKDTHPNIRSDYDFRLWMSVLKENEGNHQNNTRKHSVIFLLLLYKKLIIFSNVCRPNLFPVFLDIVVLRYQLSIWMGFIAQYADVMNDL